MGRVKVNDIVEKLRVGTDRAAAEATRRRQAEHDLRVRQVDAGLVAKGMWFSANIPPRVAPGTLIFRQPAYEPPMPYSKIGELRHLYQPTTAADLARMFVLSSIAPPLGELPKGYIELTAQKSWMLRCTEGMAAWETAPAKSRGMVVFLPYSREVPTGWWALRVTKVGHAVNARTGNPTTVFAEPVYAADTIDLWWDAVNPPGLAHAVVAAMAATE